MVMVKKKEKGDQRADDVFVQIVAVVLLLDHGTWVNQLLQVGLEQYVGDLETEDLQAAGGGAGTAADKGQVEEQQHCEAAPQWCSHRGQSLWW